MGDILGAILGTSSAQDQTTTPDVFQQAMNARKLQELVNFFNAGGPMWQFAATNPDVYTPANETQRIAEQARDLSLTPVDYSSLLSLDDYRRGFEPVTDAYSSALSRLGASTETGQAANAAEYQRIVDSIRGLTSGAIQRSYGDYGTGVQSATNTYGQVSRDIGMDYNAAISRGDYDYANALLRSEQNLSRGMGQQEYGRARALDLGLRGTGSYIDQIARPRLEQSLALQGLERGGAIPSAIARATAETAMPYLQGIEQLYGTNTAQLIAQAMGEQTQLGQSQAQQNAALGSQLMSLQGAAGNTYQNNVAQLAQALMANNITLEQAGIAANSALGQQLMQAQNSLRLQQQQGITSLASTYMPLQSNFAQSLPGASAALSMLPQQMQASKASTMMSLIPATDWQRQLKEQDFLRRQGLFQTIYTGIPFQPGSTTSQKSATGNLFNQVGGLFESFGTGGTSGGSGIT